MFLIIVLEGTVLFNFAPLVFLLAARQFANYVCIALAGSVGCEQKEPKKTLDGCLRILKLPVAQISVGSLGCGFPAQRAK
ncbi:hypothetical protein [uncultured Rikenella sp.]|uniref:hypothetical protein n=1 Tax=uncultured Rikenella sp. TaxID=368003 RepID=UPI0025EB4079|nr:hypothetical protein [uncultured Rikenella sp.]